mgnify:CR=1 FL=1
MNSMPVLTKDDQLHVQHFAEQAVGWFELVRSIVNHDQPRQPNMDDRLDIIFSLHHMTDFQDYVHPFLKNDARITAFEDAVAEAIYTAIREHAAGVS